jgi:hypothetical protein
MPPPPPKRPGVGSKVRVKSGHKAWLGSSRPVSAKAYLLGRRATFVYSARASWVTMGGLLAVYPSAQRPLDEQRHARPAPHAQGTPKSHDRYAAGPAMRARAHAGRRFPRAPEAPGRRLVLGGWNGAVRCPKPLAAHMAMRKGRSSPARAGARSLTLRSGARPERNEPHYRWAQRVPHQSRWSHSSRLSFHTFSTCCRCLARARA